MSSRGMPLTHPGASVRDSMEALGWTVTECARQLGIPRESLSRLLNGHIGISPTMALALERLGWSNARFWLRRQAYFELNQERRRQAAA